MPKMAPQIIHLPDGQKFTVTPVFAGVGFRSHEHNMHPHAFPVGWTVVLQTEDNESDHRDRQGRGPSTVIDGEDEPPKPKRHVHAYRQPTLQNDTLFISSISNPSNNEFKPAVSPTRQIAMMLWATLLWYFHQSEPDRHLYTAMAQGTPDQGKPQGDWKVRVKREGIFRSRNLIPKLERMGLITAMDSSVGANEDDYDMWANMFVSRRMFWQIPSRLFLFSLQPAKNFISMPGSPFSSRPTSPIRGEAVQISHSALHSPMPTHVLDSDLPGPSGPPSLTNSPNFPTGPYSSTSHLPTYFPPLPLLYTVTGTIRHPLRPKPVRMGEVFYNRFIPGEGRYLSFRVASASASPVPYLGPMSSQPQENTHLCTMSDTSLIQMWMAVPRVKKFWGEYTPNFLHSALSSQHSFPAIGLWDGVPFGYFEIYWVKEDILGQHLGNEAGDWDRGVHVFVGEEWARGRVPAWVSSLVHWCFTTDIRTMNVCMEPRVDNERYSSADVGKI